MLRLLYYIFPQVDWHLVFVDDYCWVLRCSRADWDATAILATLLALGVPLSWKKTALSPVNTWLGFVVDPITPCVLLAPVKHVIILATLKRLAQGDIFTSKEVEQALGRIQWATSACPFSHILPASITAAGTSANNGVDFLGRVKEWLSTIKHRKALRCSTAALCHVGLYDMLNWLWPAKCRQ